jgi:hypothetical protein
MCLPVPRRLTPRLLCCSDRTIARIGRLGAPAKLYCCAPQLLRIELGQHQLEKALTLSASTPRSVPAVNIEEGTLCNYCPGLLHNVEASHLQPVDRPRVTNRQLRAGPPHRPAVDGMEGVRAPELGPNLGPTPALGHHTTLA